MTCHSPIPVEVCDRPTPMSAHRIVLVLFAMILVVAAPVFGDEPGIESELSASLSVAMDGSLLANFPLQYKLTITNMGKKPPCYLCAGPGMYPSAHLFVASVTDQEGRTRTFGLHNGQNTSGGFAVGRCIETTETFPAASHPLPAGVYTLVVTGSSQGYFKDDKRIEAWPAMVSEPITITVFDDPAALAEADRELLARANATPFAAHLAQTYGLDANGKARFKQLLHDDPRVAAEAATHRLPRRLPPGDETILREAAAKHCHADTGSRDSKLLRFILGIARNIRTDEALDEIFIIATSNEDETTRIEAVKALGHIPEKRAEQALIDLVADEHSPIHLYRLAGLARRHNPIALAPLLRTATDENPRRRAHAVLSLGGLRDLPQAREALNRALKDADQNVRRSAEIGLQWNADLHGGITPW